MREERENREESPEYNGGGIYVHKELIGPSLTVINSSVLVHSWKKEKRETLKPSLPCD